MYNYMNSCSDKCEFYLLYPYIVWPLKTEVLRPETKILATAPNDTELYFGNNLALDNHIILYVLV